MVLVNFAHNQIWVHELHEFGKQIVVRAISNDFFKLTVKFLMVTILGYFEAAMLISLHPVSNEIGKLPWQLLFKL